MEEPLVPENELQRELAYYKKQLDLISGENIRYDFMLSSLRHELNQKKEAFSILTTLQKEFTVTTPLHKVFLRTLEAVSVHLNMDSGLILAPGSAPNVFKVEEWYGFPEEQVPMIEMRGMEVPSYLFQPGQYILVNRSIPADEFSRKVQKAFGINYFIGVPALLEEKPVAFIIAARQFEKSPFVPALNKGDIDTLSAIAGLISSLFQNKKMMELKLMMQEEMNEKNEIINIFGQQVSKDVAKALLEFQQELGSKKTIAVMFLDIRNYTPFAESISPEETVQYLNNLFGFMVEIVEKHKGIINTFLGDGFMTTFGAPVGVLNPFQNAVDAALEIHNELQSRLQANEVPYTRVGIGIHGGEAIVGNIGSSNRKQFSITGLTVNIASRIEQLTKQYNAQVLISGDVYKRVTVYKCEIKNIGTVLLKGVSQPIEIIQLI